MKRPRNNPPRPPTTAEGNYEYRPLSPPGKRPSRRSNPLMGVQFEESELEIIERGEIPRPAHKAQSHTPGRAAAKASGKPWLAISLISVAAFLVLGTGTLIVVNKFFPPKPAPAADAATAETTDLPPLRTSKPPPSPPVVRATNPAEAVRLMLTASVQGDTPTVYAQWDIKPDQVASIVRGQEMTLAELTETAQRHAAQLKPDEYQYIVTGNNGREAKVKQYVGDVWTQTYSLRRRGAFWKIYNSAAP